MIKIFNEKLDDFKHFLYNGTTKKQERIMDTICSSVLLAEKQYDEAMMHIKKNIKKEQILHLLIDICNKLIRYRLDHEQVKYCFYELIDMLDVDCVYLTKYKNNIFKVIHKWTADECITFIDFGDAFINQYDEFGLHSDFHRCYSNDKTRECVFPIIIKNKLWGTFNLVKKAEAGDTPSPCQYNKSISKCYWNIDQVYICSILSSIFSSHIKTYKLIDDLKQQNLITELTASIVKMYTWSKDEFGKYVYCTPEWKEVFFGLDKDVDIFGKTDIELLDDFRSRTGLEHTYGNVCKSSDEHCMDQGKPCYYLEAGYIGGKLFLLDVRKSPLYDDGRLRGTVGVARDLSDSADDVKKMISYYIDKGIAENLNPDNMYSDGVVAYWIKTEDAYNSVLKGILPR